MANPQKTITQKYSVKNAIVNYYLLLMFILFPLVPLIYFHGYDSIRTDKYITFLFLSMMLAIVEFFMILSESNTKNSADNMTVKKWYQTFSFTDWAMIALLIVNCISTILSAYPSDALFGTQGRNNGLLLMLAYVAIYFVITRQYRFYEYVFGGLAIGAGLVFLLAVINYFYIDPFGMFVGYNEQVIMDFTSTIGNKNLMASFVCVCLPVIMMLFMNTANKTLRWIYYISMVIGFSALLVADSDSGFLGFFTLLIVLLIYYIRKPKKLFLYFFSVFSMLAGAKILRLISLIMQDHTKEMTEIPSLFVYENGISYILIIFTLLLSVLFYFIAKRNPDLIFPNAVFITALSIAVLATAIVIYLIIKYTFIDTTSNLNQVMSYFRFTDGWGTHRGYMWRKSVEIFTNYNFKDMLFGCGPDTYFSVFTPYFSELFNLYGDQSTNCAHNEYLNYLVTIGILGLVAYLSVIIGFIIRAVKTAKVNPLAMICCAGVICYAVQAIVNIAQPITTPIFILLICIGEAVCRQVKNDNKNTFVKQPNLSV